MKNLVIAAAALIIALLIAVYACMAVSSRESRREERQAEATAPGEPLDPVGPPKEVDIDGKD